MLLGNCSLARLQNHCEGLTDSFTLLDYGNSSYAFKAFTFIENVFCLLMYKLVVRSHYQFQVSTHCQCPC